MDQVSENNVSALDTRPDGQKPICICPRETTGGGRSGYWETPPIYHDGGPEYPAYRPTAAAGAGVACVSGRVVLLFSPCSRLPVRITRGFLPCFISKCPLTHLLPAGHCGSAPTKCRETGGAEGNQQSAGRHGRQLGWYRSSQGSLLIMARDGLQGMGFSDCLPFWYCLLLRVDNLCVRWAWGCSCGVSDEDGGFVSTTWICTRIMQVRVFPDGLQVQVDPQDQCPFPIL